MAHLTPKNPENIDTKKERRMKQNRPTFEGKLKAVQLMESMLTDSHGERSINMDRHEMAAHIFKEEGVKLSVYTVADVAKAASIVLSGAQMPRHSAEQLHALITALEARVSYLEAKAPTMI